MAGQEPPMKTCVTPSRRESTLSTSIRNCGWRGDAAWSLAKQPDEVVPYKILPPAIDAVQQVVASRLRLFNGETALHSRKITHLSYDSATLTSHAITSHTIVKAQAFFLSEIPAPRSAYRDAGHQRHSSFAAFGRPRFYRPDPQEPEPPRGAAVGFAPG
jgi:hypothetical protein